MRDLLQVVSVMCVALCAALPAEAQEVRADTAERITLRGFLSATAFLQDAYFGLGNGTRAEFVREELDGWWLGGDVRNTRIALDIAGPTVSGTWRTSGTFEMDFFGGFAGAGAFGDEQPLPRIRLAFADLSNGRTRVRFGQDWALTLGEIPVSVAHLGFPLGWGSGGFIGWRFLTLSVRHGLTPPDARTQANVQVAVLQNSWSDEDDPETASAGEAGTPQLEARLDVSRSAWRAYVVGHWDRKDLGGVAPENGAPEPDDDLDSWALEAGGRVTTGALTLAANGYVGRAMGHHFAHLVQFGDIGGWGAWAQLGLDLTNNWSVWGYGGVERPDEDDIVALGNDARTESWLLVPMLRWKAGPYSTGVEWLRASTRTLTSGVERDRTANQLALSARLDF
jgi:hypothetical protein